MVKVAASQEAWQIPLLKTDEEFEEQLALHNPSPDSARLQHCLQQPRPGNSSAATNVSRNLFPPAGDYCPSQLQCFLTGIPPNCLTVSLILPVTNSQQCGQHSAGQQLFASSAMADGPYDARLQNIWMARTILPSVPSTTSSSKVSGSFFVAVINGTGLTRQL
jgi:hypothetical protein